MAKREILVDNGDKKVLKEVFNTSYNTVRTALNFQTNTLLAYKIREAALKRGGREVEVVKRKK